MTAVSSSWLVGSATTTAAATFTVDATDVDVAAGSRYLYDPTASLSWISAVQTAIASVVAGSTVYVGRDRKVRIDFDGAATTIAIPATLRPILGFTSAGYGPVTSITAERVSTLLWSPGWPETTTGSPVGVVGRRVYDRVMLSSPTGQSFDAVTHYYATRADLSWQAVRPDRAWTTDELPGEFVRFYRDVLIPAKRMKLYAVTEDDASGVAVTWPTGLGPYVVPEPDPDWYQRFEPRTDSLGANLGLSVLVTSEYS